jgi:hypothetical protein
VDDKHMNMKLGHARSKMSSLESNTFQNSGTSITYQQREIGLTTLIASVHKEP